MSDELPGLRERKKRALRQSLYDTALTLFRRDGFDAVPVSAICAEAGVAKGTFFNHFPTKDHVLLEWYEQLNSQANAIELTQGSLTDRLIAMTDGFLDISLGDADLWRAKQQRVALSEDFRQAEMRSDVQTRALAATLFADAIKSGEIGDELDPIALGDLAVTILTGSVHDWTLSNGQLDVRETVRSRLKVFVRSLARPS